MIHRRELITAAAWAAIGHHAARSGGDAPDPEAPSVDDAPLAEAGIAELRGWIDQGEVTSSGLVEAAMRRVERLDPFFGAVIETNPDAAAIARRRDAELAAGKASGALHGIPILLKDVIATGDRMRTTSGALALAKNAIVEDATIVKRLREAGAVILGKTNMTEWSNIRAPGQTAGWSDRGGQTRNPYDPTMSPWGSSSGSAAAVALGYAPAARGAATTGSIVWPAAACGGVGLKPTVGLVSRVGLMPVTWTLDSPGPIARTVADAAAVLNVIAGYDPDDPAYGVFRWAAPSSTAGGLGAQAAGAIDYTAALEPDGLRGARLGICRQVWGMDPDADAVGWAVVDRLREAGAEVVDGVVIPTLEEMAAEPGIGTIVNTEFAAGMATFFERFMPGGPVRSLGEVARWNEAHPNRALASCGQEGLWAATGALPPDHPYYISMVSYLITKARAEGLDLALDAHGLDAIIAPTVAVPTAIPRGGGTDFPGSSTQAAAFAGYPSITVPMGEARGLPVGLHLFGRAFSESTLIRLAHGVERLLPARIPPLPG